MAMRWGAGCDAARFIPGSNRLRHISTAVEHGTGHRRTAAIARSAAPA